MDWRVHPRKKVVGRLTPLLAIIAIVCSFNGCGAQPPGLVDASPSNSDGRDDPFWPADPAAVAIIASDQQTAITDGETTIDLGKRSDRFYPAAVAGEGELVALLSTSSDNAVELVAANLRTGEIRRKPCDRCNGVAVLDGHIATVIYNQNYTNFYLKVYDAQLSVEQGSPIALLTEPRSPEAITDQQFPTVHGTADNGIVISYTTTNGIARGGPSVVALYTLDGTLGRHWIVDGAVYQTATSPDGRYLALSVGGSSGACDWVAEPVLIDTRTTDQIVMSSAESAMPKNHVTTDLWWNGTQIVTSGRSEPCAVDRDMRRFSLRGEMQVIDTPHVDQYRLLGVGCNGVLMAETVGQQRTRLFFVQNGTRRLIRGYESIVWSAPRVDACALPPANAAP